MQSSSSAIPTPHTSLAAAATMTAVQQFRYGDSSAVFQAGEVAVPTPKADEVLICVHAAAIDRGTWHLMTGRPLVARVALGIRRPRRRIPGLDVAGTVVAIGEKVTRFRPGDRVFGVGRGSLAEFTCAREEKLSHIPGNLSFEQAAALGISGMTAVQAVEQFGRLQPGQRVLITGASGGVGSYAVQIARALGGEVTAICSATKADFVRSLGAPTVLDYAREDYLPRSAAYDLIVDIAGHNSLGRLRRALTPRGTLVIVGSETGERWFGGLGRSISASFMSPFVRQRLVMLVSKEHHRSLDRLAELAAAGQVTPAIDTTYPLAHAPAAMDHLVSGAVRGKLVITVDPACPG